jgi:hypothetical protein
VAKASEIDSSKHVPFMTTEHFTLQSARGIVNAEIVARVNLYFLTLSSLVVALAFLAQLGQLNEVLLFFAMVAFPALLILGFTTLTRIVQLAELDLAYIRAINRIRRFYVDQAPELHDYLLFPQSDDEISVAKYAGYSIFGFQNVLSMGFLVLVVNSLVGSGLVAALVYTSTQIAFSMVAVLTLVGVLVLAALQIIVSRRIVGKSHYKEYSEVRFPSKK